MATRRRIVGFISHSGSYKIRKPSRLEELVTLALIGILCLGLGLFLSLGVESTIFMAFVVVALFTLVLFAFFISTPPLQSGRVTLEETPLAANKKSLLLLCLSLLVLFVVVAAINLYVQLSVHFAVFNSLGIAAGLEGWQKPAMLSVQLFFGFMCLNYSYKWYLIRVGKRDI